MGGLLWQLSSGDRFTMTSQATHDVGGPLLSIVASDAILSYFKELAKDSNQPLFGWPADRQVIGLET